MKRILPMLVVFIAACADRHLLINHHYRTDGYEVKGMHGAWQWDEKRGTTTLTTGEGFDQRVYVDKNRDHAVDTVRFRNETFVRGQDGAADLFQRADEDFELARQRYEMDDVDKEWREMSPDERARRQDYFK
ncbi:MAG: hypothetical protein K8T20_20970 [Planctomycetes bacterium]|nr:hypothetical protein [Planctomycetota bacterium]